MINLRSRSSTAALVVALLTSPSAVAPASASAEEDPLLARVAELLQEARREIRQFEEADEGRGDPDHPVGRWADRLWEFRGAHPGTPAAGRAATEAIHLLVHAERAREAHALAEGLPLDDPAWRTLGGVLFEAAMSLGEYDFLVGELRPVIDARDDAEVREGLRYYVGRGLWKSGDEEGARAAFEAVVEGAPESKVAKRAEAALYELLDLGYGQPSPTFSTEARDGSAISLADYRGRTVLLIFWAST